MAHPFECQCGTVRGEVLDGARSMRAVCYCRDCRTYAHWLGEPARVVDALGGTDIVATQSRYVRFTAGSSALACMALSPRGLLRWYASCCKTAIANIPRDPKLPYVGLVHTCLAKVQPLERSFPPVQMDINSGSALGPTPRRGGPVAMAKFGAMVLGFAATRLTGSYRITPFFDANGQTTVPVHVPPIAEVQAARQSAG